MNIVIKKMESDAEMDGKAYVQWKSWHEAYSAIVSREYLERLTLDKCKDMAHRWTENILVAMDGEKVAGFAGYGKYHDDTLDDVGDRMSHDYTK
ncbi:MAG: hypothetical protein LKF52_14060 [Butyrivibrio sp.]|jgi:hypothetical protein|nr:hypothetical protein [Butyrivibrio sp.]